MLVWMIIFSVLCPVLASASAVVCAVTATPSKVSRFNPSSEPSRFVVGTTETCGWIVGDAATAQQIDLWRTVPFQYLKVVPNATIGGEVQPQSLAEMDATEKQQVDTLIAEEQARRAAWNTELETAGVCKYNTPAEIDTKIDQVKTNNQNNINAMSLSATDKQQLITVTNRLSEGLRQISKCDAARASGG